MKIASNKNVGFLRIIREVYLILIQWDAHLGFNKELRGDVNNPILQTNHNKVNEIQADQGPVEKCKGSGERMA